MCFAANIHNYRVALGIARSNVSFTAHETDKNILQIEPLKQSSRKCSTIALYTTKLILQNDPWRRRILPRDSPFVLLPTLTASLSSARRARSRTADAIASSLESIIICHKSLLSDFTTSEQRQTLFNTALYFYRGYYFSLRSPAL